MNCPLCGDLAVLIRTTLRDGTGNVYRCDRCDFEMLDGPTVDYDGEYRKTHGPVLGKSSTPEEIFEAYKDQQAERVALVPTEGTLLEIGCSAGMFLHAVRDDLKGVVGVEPDSACRQYACEQTGCDIYPAIEYVGKFDTVCMFQTLEHIPNPVEYLTHLRKHHLKPGGRIIVEVPSLTDPLLTLWDCPAYRDFFYHAAHLWYFSPRSLMLAMNMAGFNGEIRHSQVYGLENALQWVYTGKPQPDNRQSWPELALEIVPSLSYAATSYRRFTTDNGHGENITFIGRGP